MSKKSEIEYFNYPKDLNTVSYDDLVDLNFGLTYGKDKKLLKDVLIDAYEIDRFYPYQDEGHVYFGNYRDGFQALTPKQVKDAYVRSEFNAEEMMTLEETDPELYDNITRGSEKITYLVATKSANPNEGLLVPLEDDTDEIVKNAKKELKKQGYDNISTKEHIKGYMRRGFQIASVEQEGEEREEKRQEERSRGGRQRKREKSYEDLFSEYLNDFPNLESQLRIFEKDENKSFFIDSNFLFLVDGKDAFNKNSNVDVISDNSIGQLYFSGDQEKAEEFLKFLGMHLDELDRIENEKKKKEEKKKQAASSSRSSSTTSLTGNREASSRSSSGKKSEYCKGRTTKGAPCGKTVSEKRILQIGDAYCSNHEGQCKGKGKGN